MTKQDLQTYLRMLEREGMKNQARVKTNQAPDMTEKLESMAREAINKYHNVQ